MQNFPLSLFVSSVNVFFEEAASTEILYPHELHVLENALDVLCSEELIMLCTMRP